MISYGGSRIVSTATVDDGTTGGKEESAKNFIIRATPEMSGLTLDHVEGDSGFYDKVASSPVFVSDKGYWNGVSWIWPEGGGDEG